MQSDQEKAQYAVGVLERIEEVVIERAPPGSDPDYLQARVNNAVAIYAANLIEDALDRNTRAIE